ncbi:hypothetical protein FGO68_gene12801 [Halteria grandinella]|uniref:Uncharacterized protein n=1 Tax=Halteria grandinella TaxID=5974 RepID=A0A8J8T744_HALGN|nr:hypothetical protein FGO68_gene12801 [Halteria grandinella]
MVNENIDCVLLFILLTLIKLVRRRISHKRLQIQITPLRVQVSYQNIIKKANFKSQFKQPRQQLQIFKDQMSTKPPKPTILSKSNSLFTKCLSYTLFRSQLKPFLTCLSKRFKDYQYNQHIRVFILKDRKIRLTKLLLRDESFMQSFFRMLIEDLYLIRLVILDDALKQAYDLFTYIEGYQTEKGYINVQNIMSLRIEQQPSNIKLKNWKVNMDSLYKILQLHKIGMNL